MTTYFICAILTFFLLTIINVVFVKTSSDYMPNDFAFYCVLSALVSAIWIVTLPLIIGGALAWIAGSLIANVINKRKEKKNVS